MDRFNDAEIFVTLREINSLVNENSSVKRNIRFLYALRDDMFVNTDRTKFFEFIIPVIPIINTSNSIDMILHQGRRLELDDRLDRQFLREVSRYLNDLRLIQNIFNEFAIYVTNLETDGENLLDANKLLAILIYKNVYPRDFERLHRGTGILAEILNLQEELIETGETTYRREIAKLEKQLEIAEQQVPSDLRELRQIYAMALIEKLPANHDSVSVDRRNWIKLSKLSSHDELELFISATRLSSRNDYYNNESQIDVSTLQNEVDSQRTYHQRMTEIENGATDNKNKSLREIHELRSKLAVIRTTKLDELLRLNTNHAHGLFEKFGENGELARFLVLEGYLDDTYYQYTSLFHSGRLSPNDNKFLIQIRAFVTPEPLFPIDNPKEVIAAMRDEDFRQSYVLNIKLVDSLLSGESNYTDQTKKLFEFLSNEFETCEEFFDVYYTSGRNILALLSGLLDYWKGFIPAVISSPNNIVHVSQLVASLQESKLKMLAKDFDGVPKFVSEKLPEILVNVPELEPERLLCLNFEVKDLNSIKEHSEIARFMFEQGLFELTIANIEYVFEVILGEKNLESLRTRNYTTIRSASNAVLKTRVERDFDSYLRDILLCLQDNLEEDASAILAVIRHDNLDQVDLQGFLERQITKLPTLESVPERLYALLFQLYKIEPAWDSCLTFMEIDEFDAEIFIGYLDRDDVRHKILECPIPSEPDFFQLRKFLFEAGALSDEAYRGYVCALPNQFEMPSIGIESTKLRILIEERKIIFTPESLAEIDDERELQVLFVAMNIDIFLDSPDEFELDDDLLADLLKFEIKPSAKLKIIEMMDLEAIIDLPERAALIGPILNGIDATISNLNGDVVHSLILNTMPLASQISLFNKYHSFMTDEEVRQVLANLPGPYCDIKTGYFSPRLKNNDENMNLVKWLDSRKIISSWSESGLFSNDIKVNLYRRLSENVI
ncbi:ATP-binding protein [Amphritea spongicola]|nr:ATP-binding protein [Aliamphritea spongicola]MBN3560987.1 ATP-binding protein [Aliamphritea spongicola]